LVGGAFAAALGERYRLERELGHGGMAVVWLAQDLKHGRPVALKVLRPELSAVIGADRFRREIRLTAGLQHPNILPLHDSGEAAGLLYYVMPFVAGETLRDRLAREGALPTADAVRLAGEIGGALSHAHRHGIVHRDVKPENVLLADGHALVADFGIARAAGGERLTETGMAVGTPSYMSPEQGAGDVTDARSDQYALAAVTYEMLAGEPPFTGPTAQSVMAKHVAQPAPSIRTTRPAVPMHVDAALQRALAKQPADRFAGVAALVDALQHTPTLPTAPAVPRRHGPAGRRTMLAAAVAAIALALGWWLTHPNGAREAAYDLDAVAVVPFRVEGADPALGYLGEGMVDLVAAKMPGGGGLRAMAPRATLAAWRSEASAGADDPARAVARRLGAGLVLDGSVVGVPGRLTLNASLRDAARGTVVGTGQVSGPADSLPSLVDALVVGLLGERSGVTTQRLAGMTSVPALQAYLAGLTAYRESRYNDAEQHFTAALREDSAFALAALAAIPAAYRSGQPARVEEAERRAWPMRGRLHGADSVLLRAYVGENGPGERSILQTIADWERAVAAVPDRAEAWFELGDRQLHFGNANDYPGALPKARRNLERALALDSSLAVAVDHLLLLALHERDSAAAVRLAPLYRRTGSRGGATVAFDWVIAVTQGDSAAARAIRAVGPNTPQASLEWIAGLAQLETGSRADAELAVAEIVRRAGTAAESRAAEFRAWQLALNLGHPAAAEAAARRALGSGPSSAMFDYFRAISADFWDGDSVAGAAARARLSAAPDAGAALDDFRRDGAGLGACTAGLHAIAREDSAGVRQGLVRLQRMLPAEPQHTAIDDNRRLCAGVLEAALAVAARSESSRELLARADSIMLQSNAVVYHYFPLVLARLLETSGDAPEALRVLRRRDVGVGLPGPSMLLAPILREEGRLAASLGDEAGAVRAYRHYLGLRGEPDASLVPQRDSTRAALAALRREPRPDSTSRR
jgi:serine/threonine-protein kinase